MSRIARILFHYAHAISMRSLLVSEYFLQKKINKNYPSNLLFKILKVPSKYEDRINVSRFIGVEENVLLLDVGGNTGYWAEEFVSFFKNTKVIAFEPTPEVAATYEDRLRGVVDVDMHQVALSSSEGIASFNIAVESTFSTLENYSSTQDERDIKLNNVIEVETKLLDSFNVNVETFDKVFLKIDVQGHEIEVLKGAVETLKKVDCVLIELSFAHEYEGLVPSFAETTEIMRAAGLYPIVFQNYGRTLSPYAWERDVIFVKEVLLEKIWGW